MIAGEMEEGCGKDGEDRRMERWSLVGDWDSVRRTRFWSFVFRSAERSVKREGDAWSLSTGTTWKSFRHDQRFLPIDQQRRMQCLRKGQ